MKTMKTIFILILMAFCATAYCQYPNPASVYADKMGLKHDNWRDSHNNQFGRVIFPDGTTGDEWDFYRGRIGKKYSYCVKKGYEMTTDTIQHKGWVSIEAVCVKKPKGDSPGIKIPMLELMEQNGDTLIRKTGRK